MPVDGFKIKTIDKDYANRLIQNPNFDFISTFSNSTGEIKDGKEARFRGLIIRVYNSGVVLVSGSFHKYKNDGVHNYDSFYLVDLIKIIHEIKELLCFDLTTAKIENLEFGVNITPPLPTKEILKNIISHKRESFKSVSHPNSDYKECVHQHFIIKTYDKAKQYSQSNQILRFEAKYLKMAELNGIGINYLSDLLNISIYGKLEQILNDTWNEVLFIDPTVNNSKLTVKQQEDLKDWINPHYWNQLTEHPIKKKFNTEKDRYQKIIKENSQNIHYQISKLITKKWEQLTEIPIINQEILTNIKSSENQKTGTITHLYKGLIIPTPKKWTNPKLFKICPVTRQKIHNQRSGSKFLSIGGLKWLCENDKQTFEKLRIEMLTKRWLTETLDIQIREISHQIRNRYFNPSNNPRNNAKTSIKKVYSYPVLFNSCEFMKPDKLKLAEFECN